MSDNNAVQNLMCYTHRPADEEHCDCSNQWDVSDQRLEDHTQLPMELQRENAIL